MHVKTCCTFVLVSLILMHHAYAQCEVQKLTAVDAPGEAYFGSSISLNGEWLFVGAGGSHCNDYYGCGAVYVFRRTGADWERKQVLSIANAAGNDIFGSVSVSGDVAIVGAFGRDCQAGPSCGEAYVYRFDGSQWMEEQRLAPADPNGYDRFGISVSIDGNLAVIGAWAENYDNAAYIFRFDGSAWVQEQRLAPSDGYFTNAFGRSVSVKGTAALVGAPGDNCGNMLGCGAAYLFQFDGSKWTERQKLVARTREPSYLGASVAFSGDLIVLGAPGGPLGAVHVFRYRNSVWVEEQEIPNPHDSGYDNFGGSVAVASDVLVAGANGVNCDSAIDCGVAHVNVHDGTRWVGTQTLEAGDMVGHAEFGASVSLDANTVVVGASQDHCHYAMEHCGAAYIFVHGPDCNENGQADFCDIRDSGVDDVNANGVPDECELVGSLDIMPRKCPNRMKAYGGGMVKAALMGSEAFDVRQVDVETLELRRTDGVGEAIRPIQHGGRTDSEWRMRNGEDRMEGQGTKGTNGGKGEKSVKGEDGDANEKRLRIRDVATFRSNHSCECGENGPDGFDDLVLRFDARELGEAFELDGEENGASIVVTIRGAMLDDTIFEASDCIVVGRPE